MLAACTGGGSVGGHDPLPAALQAWVAFPVDASPRPIVLVETEPLQHRAHLRFHCISITRAKFIFDAMKTLGYLRVLAACMIEL